MAKKPKLEEGVLELKNAGPIEGVFRADVSKGPGLYTLTGAKATGKSTVLKSLELLKGHKVEITIHDGEMDGHVSGFGVVAPLGPRRKPSGELELETLEGATFADFIQPQGKTGVTRDKACIQSLVALTGVKADPADYYELLGGKEEFKKLGIDDTDDPIALCKRVKAKLEERARDAETAADVEKGHVEAIEARVAQVNLAASCHMAALMEAMDAAKTRRDTLIEKAEAAAAKKEEIARAREQLAQQREAYKGKSVDQAKAAVDSASEDVNAQGMRVNELTTQIAQLQSRLVEEKADLLELQRMQDAAAAELELVRQHHAAMSAWEATIAEKVEEPGEDELDAAKAAVEAAVEAYNMGVKVRDAKQDMERAKSHRIKSLCFKETADNLRASASQTFPILTSKLQTNEILIEQIEDEARLVVKHPTRGKKVFFNEEGDLSEGQRIIVAIKELLPRVNAPGLFDVPQHVFAGIQPADRKELHEFAVKHGIYLWGAIIDDGELAVKYGA
jgi:hypothetical protein